MRMRNILITGASRGIGRAIAKIFAPEDCNLFINSLHGGSKLDECVEELTSIRRRSAGTGIIVPIKGDVGDPQFVRGMFEEISKKIRGERLNNRPEGNSRKKAEFGSRNDMNKEGDIMASCNNMGMNVPGLDILINNAGISHVGLLQDMPDEKWERIIATNLSSVHYCCKAAIPGMLAAGGGRIINISSVWGNVGASCEVAYSATKGGVNAYTKALARELAPSHIAVNAIACGCIDTDMNKIFSSDERAALCEEIPAGRFADPDEVAKLVKAVAEQSDYLTGQIITLDGGWM